MRAGLVSNLNHGGPFGIMILINVDWIYCNWSILTHAINPLPRRDKPGRRADRTHRAVEVRQGHAQLLPTATGRGAVRDRGPVPVPRGAVRPGMPGAGRAGGARRPAPLPLGPGGCRPRPGRG